MMEIFLTDLDGGNGYVLISNKYIYLSFITYLSLNMFWYRIARTIFPIYVFFHSVKLSGNLV